MVTIAGKINYRWKDLRVKTQAPTHLPEMPLPHSLPHFSSSFSHTSEFGLKNPADLQTQRICHDTHAVLTCTFPLTCDQKQTLHTVQLQPLSPSVAMLSLMTGKPNKIAAWASWTASVKRNGRTDLRNQHVHPAIRCDWHNLGVDDIRKGLCKRSCIRNLKYRL